MRAKVHGWLKLLNLSNNHRMNEHELRSYVSFTAVPVEVSYSEHQDFVPAQETYRGHACSVCGKIFPAKSHVKVHMRVHTGAKPYECEMCGKRFSQKNNLKTHQMVHIFQRNK